MADNAPYAIDQSPRPNIVLEGFNRRVHCYVATISVSGGTPSIVASESSAGLAVADTNTGRITLTFPAGGTGATGFIMDGPVQLSTPSGRTSIDVDSDLTNYATGTLEVDTWIEDGTSGIATAGDISGKFTLFVFVIAA